MNDLNAIRYAVVLLATLAIAVPASEAAERPNIVVIMADDLGYSDIGCYGGEIDTPHLDALAAHGIRFSQFYNTAKCHSSRVSLLSGQYCVAAGDTSLSHAVTSAEVLGEGGYFTAMTGKWHLKKEPTDFGFDRYFGHLSGACNFFSGDNTFRLNGEPWKVPDQDFYTTVADVDYALRFLDEARQTAKPWYLYIAFNAPHAPLHALPADYAKYKGRYQHGWDKIRAARIEKQKRLGLIPASLKPSPRPEHIPAWTELKDWQRDYESNRMTTLAAMIDRVDQEIGRLISDLRQHQELNNTLFLFVSDNGACPYDRKPALLNVEPTNAETSFGDSTGWSWARNSPFRYYKQNQFEGGISTPAILHWPAGVSQPEGSIIDQPAHLIDVMPTLAEIASCEIPSVWQDRELRPVSGVSLKPILDGNPLGSRPPIHFRFSNDRGLRQGDWKLVSFRGEAWELYNVAVDRTELNNLADSQPERLQAMIQTWNEMAKNVLHAPGSVYAPVTEAKLPHHHPEWTNFAAETPAEYTTRGLARRSKSQKRAPKNAIRARKNTRLTIVDKALQLEFTGDDPGIAMDLRGQRLPTGPYHLSFELVGGTKDGGEVFFTTDPKVTLPKGDRQSFDVVADGNPQAISLRLQTTESIQLLRIDVSSGAGEAVITDLRLSGQDGKLLMAWPK